MKKCSIYTLFILIYIIITKKVYSITYDCQQLTTSIGQMDSSIFNATTLILTGFNAFKELEVNCFLKFSIYLIQIIPNKNMILDQTLNLSGLELDTYNAKNVFLYFSNLNGIDLKADSKFYVKSAYIERITIEYSKFDFYYDNVLIDKVNCENFTTWANNTFFISTKQITFRNFNKYSKSVCPLVFNNTNLAYLSLEFISNSFLNKNQFEFLNMSKQNELKNFNSKIKFSLLMITYDMLSEKVFNKKLFQNIQRLRIEGNIYYFQPDLFSNSNNLIRLYVKLFNQREFFHNGNEWFGYLKYKQKEYNMDTVKSGSILFITFNTYVLQLFQEIYDYPDEDFCLFHHFPHNKLVYPKIDPGIKVNCSCTILWLLKYTFKYFLITNSTEYTSNFEEDSFFSQQQTTQKVPLSYCLFQPNFESLIRSCNFDSRIALCNKTTYGNKPTSFWNNYDIFNDLSLTQTFKAVELLVLVVLNPICAVLGILLNILIIIVITNFKNLKKQKPNSTKIKLSMFKHILINSVFNVIYCFIMLFKLFNECLFFTSTIYCPRISFLKETQWFKIIVVEFLGNIAKICSNVSYIGIVMSRLNIIKTKKKGVLKKCGRFKLKIYIVLLILFSSILSTFKLFEYKIDRHEFAFGNFDFPIEKRSFIYCSRQPNECKLFTAVKLAYNFINDVLFYLITILVDMLLLKNLKEKFQKKKKLVKKFNEDDENNRKRINKLVFINGLVYLIAHLPEFLTIIMLTVFKKKMESFCLNQMTCDKFNEVAQFFNYFSIILQFFINIEFNKQFKESFILIKSKLNARKKKDPVLYVSNS